MSTQLCILMERRNFQPQLDLVSASFTRRTKAVCKLSSSVWGRVHVALARGLRPPTLAMKGGVAVSQGCHNQMPQPGGLQTTEMYPLLTGGQKSRSRCRPVSSFWRLRRKVFPRSVPASGAFWSFLVSSARNASLRSLSVMTRHLPVCLCGPLVIGHQTVYRATQSQWDLILT